MKNLAQVVMFLLGLSMVSMGALVEPVIAQTAPQHPILASMDGFHSKTNTVHLRASFDISIRLPLYEGHPAPVSGYGFVEHWEQEDMFRTKVWVDPRLSLADNLDIAYDGTHYQVYWPDTGVLTIEDPQPGLHGLMIVPGAVPNPLYLPVAHLAPADDDCPGCQPTMLYLQDQRYWGERIAASTGNESTGNDISTFDLAGGMQGGVAYTFRVHMRSQDAAIGHESDHVDIQKIERLRADGQTISSIILSNELTIPVKSGDGKHLRFPKTIRVDAYDPDQPGQSLLMRVDYTIEALEVDGEFDDVFEIKRSDAASVWEKGQLMTQKVP